MTDSTAPTPRTAVKARLLSSISKAESGCWDWNKSKNAAGYGTISVKNKITVAHRASYAAFIGEIPAGKYVCHSCDNPSCINPSHLFIGSPSDNLMDCYSKMRRPKTGPTRGACKLAHLSPPQAELVKNEIALKKKTLKEIAIEFGVSVHVIKGVSRGRNY